MPQLSIWEKETFFAKQDVVIIGSGFSGLWSALYLKLLHPHYKVTILERGLIPTGVSTRNAGFSCFGSPSELINDARVMGEDNMWNLVAMRYKGIREIRNAFPDEEIEYETCGGYECFTVDSADSTDWADCEQQLNWLNDGLKKITGEANVFFNADEKLAEFGFAGFAHMIENKLEGSLHPGRLVKALLNKVHALDVQVLTGIEVIEYSEENNGVHITTNQSINLLADRVLICTNAFTGQLVPGIDIIPNRGQVLITNKIDNLRFKGTFHFDKGFYYFRNLDNRLLLGGARQMAFEDENTSVMKTTDVIQQELENFISRHILPSTQFTITDRWAGIMAMGNEKAPIVKAISKNVFCSVRMSGMGVALAPIAARQIIQLMDADAIT